jgi:Glycosyltransferase family 87
MIRLSLHKCGQTGIFGEVYTSADMGGSKMQQQHALTGGPMPQIVTHHSPLITFLCNARLQTWGLWFLAVLAVSEGCWTVFFRDNDFLWHRHHGQHFLEGRPHGAHYLPARGFMDIPLAIGPYRLTRAVVYCLAIALLLACYRLWNDMAARSAPPSMPAVRAAGMLTVLLLLPYVFRDLDECGLQIILMFFLTMAGWLLSRGKGVWAGFWLGTAACYKATPLLFLPFLLWKSQWRSAAAMAGCFLLWCAAPSLYSGWEHNLQAHKDWLAGMHQQHPTQQAYPSLPGGGDLKWNNMSLLAGIARYLETYPSDHPLFKDDPILDHPCFFQFGNLAPAAATLTMFGILGILGLWFAWKTRRNWCRLRLGENGDGSARRQSLSGAFEGEWAAVCALCALLSPLCWKQHMVLILPCMFLVLRNVFNTAGAYGRRLTLIGICSALMCLLPGPDILGGNFSAVLHSYKLHTLGSTILMIWAVFLSDKQERLTGSSGTDTSVCPIRAAFGSLPAADGALPRAA